MDQEGRRAAHRLRRRGNYRSIGLLSFSGGRSFRPCSYTRPETAEWRHQQEFHSHLSCLPSEMLAASPRLSRYLRGRLARITGSSFQQSWKREKLIKQEKCRKVDEIQPHFCRNSISIIKIKAKRAETRYKIKHDNDDQTTAALTTFSSLASWTGFKGSYCLSLASDVKPDSAHWPRIRF